jgi:hypothetical protein
MRYIILYGIVIVSSSQWWGQLVGYVAGLRVVRAWFACPLSISNTKGTTAVSERTSRSGICRS